MKKSEIRRILFYTQTPRAFHTTLIGHLYEISQVYPVMLLSEKLDSVTEKALKNKELFPKLEKIIPVEQFTGKPRNLFSKNIYFYKLAKNVIEQYKPDTVITGDIYPFELYLSRFAKRINALKVSIQVSNVTDGAITRKWADLTNAYLRFPSSLPLGFRLFLVKCRKYFGHFLYYWILPLIVGEKPFFGKSSYILRKGNSGMRDADYQVVFSKRDYNVYLKDGVPSEKLYILPHPLDRGPREFFNRIYFDKFGKQKKARKAITLMLPAEIEFGFKRSDHSLISRKDREKDWIEIIKLITQIFLEWKIYIKPHPDTENLNKIKESLESISDNIEVVNPQEPADKYIEIVDIIIELPLSVSTTLFTASLQCPEKPILSLDFHQELLGDYYKNFEGIEYVDNKEKFINILESIRDNRYRKIIPVQQSCQEEREFSDAVEIIEFLFNKKNKIY